MPLEMAIEEIVELLSYRELTEGNQETLDAGMRTKITATLIAVSHPGRMRHDKVKPLALAAVGVYRYEGLVRHVCLGPTFLGGLQDHFSGLKWTPSSLLDGESD